MRELFEVEGSRRRTYKLSCPTVTRCVNAALAADDLCVVGTYRANIHRFSALSEAQRETGEFQREVG